MKTYSAKPTDIVRKWYVIDASQAPLGRLASRVASLLIGKSKPNFTRHLDGGDFVIVIRAAELVVTGNKTMQKRYYRHSNYPGGLKQATLSQVMARDPTRVIIQAVRGMLPVNSWREQRLKRLKVYPGDEHAHAAQKPEVIDIKAGK
ncbi:50S ribosomal protein L13 [Candidatus Saccharibacteria bacterium]|nr:50S ribosomal protein L13 [Candidatus Saccharibacteria bacterium]